MVKIISLLALTSLVIYNGYWLSVGASFLDIFRYYTFQTNLMVVVYGLSNYRNENVELAISLYLIPTLCASYYFRNGNVFEIIDHLVTPLLFILLYLRYRGGHLQWWFIIYPILYIVFIIIYTKISGRVIYPFMKGW